MTVSTFPIVNDVFSTKSDGVDRVLADHVNYLQSAVANLEKYSPLTLYALTGKFWFNLQDPTYGGGAKGDNLADDGAAINLTIAAALAVGNAVVYAPPGIYKHSVSLTPITKTTVDFIGAGSTHVTFKPTAAVTGDCIQITTNPFTTTQAGRVGGFYIDGTNAAAGACGFHYGDVIGGEVDDLWVENFFGAGSKGIWVDNRTNWTERTTWNRIRVGNCKIHVLYDVNGGTNSHGYQRVQSVDFQINAGQTGIQFQNGAHFYNGFLGLRGNSGGAGSAVMKINDTALVGFATGGVQFAVQVEGTGVGSPAGLVMAAGANLGGNGIIDLSLGGLTSSDAGTQNIQFGGFFNCPGIFSVLGEGLVAYGLTVRNAPNYPTGPGLFSDDNAIFVFGKAGQSVALRPNGPGSANGQFVGFSTGWWTYDGAGVQRNVLDDGSGNIKAAAGLQVGPGQSLDTSAAGALSIGPSTATSIVLGKGTLAPSFPGGLTIAAAKAIDTTAAGALNIGPATATSIVIGASGFAVGFPGGLTVAAAKALDTTTAGALNIGPATATSIVIGASGFAVGFPGGLTVAAAKALDTTTAGALNIGPATATSIVIGAAGFAVGFPGGLTIAAAKAIDTTTAGALTIGGTNANALNLGNATSLVNFAYAATALGGGAAPTFGTIGGSGPATAAQNAWLKLNVNGTASFVPLWR